MCSGIATASITAGKDFAAPVVMFFLWDIIRQSCFLFLEFFFLMHWETSALESLPWILSFWNSRLIYLNASSLFLNGSLSFLFLSLSPIMKSFSPPQTSDQQKD